MNSEFLKSYNQIIDSANLAGKNLEQFFPLSESRCLGIQQFQEHTTLFIYDISIAGSPIYAIRPSFGDFRDKKDVHNAAQVLALAATKIADKYGRTPKIAGAKLVRDNKPPIAFDVTAETLRKSHVYGALCHLFEPLEKVLPKHNDYKPYVGRLCEIFGVTVDVELMPQRVHRTILSFPTGTGEVFQVSRGIFEVKIINPTEFAPNIDSLGLYISEIIAALVLLIDPPGDKAIES